MESNSKKVFKGISSQTLVTVLSGVLEIVVFSIMSRLLTKEDFGLFASVTAITIIFSSLSEAGIGAALIQRKDASNQYINTAFTLSFFSGVVFSLLLVLISAGLSSFFGIEHLRTALMFMSITIFCNCITSVNNALLYKKMAFFKVGMINLTALFLSSIIAIILAYKGFGVYAIIAKVVLAGIITSFVSYKMAHYSYKFVIASSDVKSIFGFAGWLTLSVIIRNLAHQADRLLMTKYLSIASLGAYNRPKEFITNITTKLNGIFDTVLFPILSNIQDEKEKMKRSFSLSLCYLNIFSLFLSLGFIFNCELIIKVFFGENWMSLSNLFRLLSIYMLLYTDGRLCDCYFRSLGIVKYQFYLRIIELVLTVVFLLLSFRWDVIGVACAILMVQFLMVITKLLIVSNHLDMPFKEVVNNVFKSWKSSLIVIPIMVVFYFILPHTIMYNIAYLVIYVVTIMSLLLFFPSLIGRQYQDYGYSILIDKLTTLKNKLYGKKCH